MKTENTFRSSFTLQRKCETGNEVVTTLEYVMGMPDMLVIKQGINRIEITGPETRVFQYVVSEFNRFRTLVKDDNEY